MLLYCYTGGKGDLGGGSMDDGSNRHMANVSTVQYMSVIINKHFSMLCL